ncbi:FAD-dependent monooxygenase [Marinobacterium rhizophilum]|uniref:FAD-dependent monooxygenase n=1 Tax=Marinobacterium rhizophilum TaxID=420402 RepID=A0ABY5HCZ3_9GAMM|nr:FAD-dependent monooxygenase [Marinobacterium rhizophilum]UTW10150.1 FAD-dependent monooxygenase [Marinobacterium rhizophilum]
MAGLTIGISGGGVGGLAAAIALRAQGHKVIVFEQAAEFARIGADINLTPNAVRALDGLGVGEKLRETAARPSYRISRLWDSGEETSRLEMADSAVQKYGAPQLTTHRADLLSALQAAIPADAIRFGKKVRQLEQCDGGVRLQFEDGTEDTVDVLVGADGIHSTTRTALFGQDAPEFTGIVSYRAVVPAHKLDVPNLDCFTKWWGPIPEMQIVTFPLNRGRDTFVFATTPLDNWHHESWTMSGDVNELREIYKDFHPEARALLQGCTEVTKSALYVREPLPLWSEGAVTLLGDAAHPMVPFMAQGACMAIEDAVVLGRAFEGVTRTDVGQALQCYENARKERTARVQRGSRGNEWLKAGGNADWVYGYDAWNVPLNG